MPDETDILIHDLQQLGFELRTRRKAAGLSSTRFAEFAGISRDTLNRLEKGGDVNLTTLFQTLQALGLYIQITRGKQPELEDAPNFYLRGIQKSGA